MKSVSFSIRFNCLDNEFNLKAVADTGNKLKELISGKPIIICKGISIDTNEIGIPVPYSTISDDGLIYAFKPEYVEIRDYKNNVYKPEVYIAFSDRSNDEPLAIFDPEII